MFFAEFFCKCPVHLEEFVTPHPIIVADSNVSQNCQAELLLSTPSLLEL